jgi:hypothetical protein
MASLEGGVLFSLFLSSSHGVFEVVLREDSVMGDGVVVPGWDVIVKMGEVGSILHSKDEWEITIAIIDTIQLFTLQKLFHVVFDDWGLVESSVLVSGSLNVSAVTEGKNVGEFCVEECICSRQRVHCCR